MTTPMPFHSPARHSIWRPKSSRGTRRRHAATSIASACCCFTWQREIFPFAVGRSAIFAPRTDGEIDSRFAALRPDLPRALARVIDRALSVAPDARFADAAAMADALRDISRRAARRRQIAILTAAAVLLVAGVSTWMRFAGGASPGGGVAAFTPWTQMPANFVQKVNLRGPSVDGIWAPCTSPWGSRNVALCNLHDASVRVLRRSPRTSSIGQLPGRSALSPDGRLLAYVWAGEPDADIVTVFVIGIDGRNNRELYRTTTLKGGVTIEQWSADGRALVARERDTSGAGRVLLIPITGRAPRELWQLTARDFSTALSPDGQALVIERKTVHQTTI